MIRVLQFADVVNRHDFIDTIVQRADPSRFEVGVCVRSSESRIAAPVYEERTPQWVLGGAARREWPRAAWQLAGILSRWRADILHAHHYDQAVIGWMATRICPRARLVLGRHYSDAIYRVPSKVKRKAYLKIERSANNGAARIIVPSALIREILTERQGVRLDKVDLIPYGFEPEKYRPPAPSEIARLRDELGLEGRFAIGTFARLHEEKGHRFLLEAVASLKERVPSLLLLVVGEGPERAAIERQIESAGLGHLVRLLGWRRDAMELMASVDAVAQPTLQEAFSQVMVEALWMRKPLVITDVSGAPDIITDGVNGLLVPRGDAGALARAIERLAGDPALRARLGESGQAYVRNNLLIGKIISRYEQSYLQAMES